MILDTMSPSPRDKLRDVIIANLGEQLRSSEVTYKSLDIPPGCIRAGVMLPDFAPIAAGDVIQLRRDGR